MNHDWNQGTATDAEVWSITMSVCLMFTWICRRPGSCTRSHFWFDSSRIQQEGVEGTGTAAVVPWRVTEEAQTEQCGTLLWGGGFRAGGAESDLLLCLSQSRGTGRQPGTTYSRPNFSPVSLLERWKAGYFTCPNTRSETALSSAINAGSKSPGSWTPGWLKSTPVFPFETALWRHMLNDIPPAGGIYIYIYTFYFILFYFHPYKSKNWNKEWYLPLPWLVSIHSH